MPDMNCRVKRFGPRVALLWGILGLIMLLPSTVWAGGHTVYVPAPNKVDDTANLQSALDACVAYGKGCTVQLAAGTYLTSQLVEYNFQGTFKGMGQSKTTIQALPNLPVADFTQGACKPNTTDCLWPSLIIFVDGNITVSDLTVNEPNIPATQPWPGLGPTCLNDGIYFTGQNRTNASVQRVTVKGMPDNSPTSCPDFNLCNGVFFAGELPRTPFDYYSLSGAFSLSKSSFTNVQLGVVVAGLLQDSKITIGGSPTAGNVFQNVDVGPVLIGAQNSVEEVSYNTSAGNWEPVYIGPSEFVPNKPSLYLVHDNNLMPTGPSANGMWLEDDPTHHWLYGLVYNNTIDGQDIGFGIAVISTTGTTILNNKISGKGGLGIGIFDASHAAVLINDVTGFTADPSLAQIVLDGSLFGVPDTSNSTVVCKTPSDTVMDIGTNDKVIGCQQTANSTAAASGMIARPKALKKKPLVH